MSKPEDTDSTKAPDTGQQSSTGGKRSGRVGFDERGNSVWEWQLETGVYSRDVSTRKLKKLELGELSIADTAVNKRPPDSKHSEEAVERKRAGGGFNPYDNSAPVRGEPSPHDKAHARAQPQPNAGPAPVKRTPADMRRLSEWVKLKRRMEDSRDPGGDRNGEED